MNSDLIAIVGSALATSLGITCEQTWEAVRSGKCGIAPPPEIESPLPPGADAGQAMNLPFEFAPELPREVRYLKWTIQHALRDAGLSNQLPPRTGVMLGTTLHGIRAGGQYFRTLDPAPLHHFLAGNTLELATRDLSIDGLCATTCSACSSSLGAIALAITLLQSHQLDLVIAGGYDTISEYAYGGFNSLRLVAEGPLRPFARNRQGMKLAEGYGIVALQRLSDAEAQNRTVHGIIAGFGESADAHHLTQPHPKGKGANRAMISALESAEISASQIHLIAAHGTGTPDNDAGEYAALHKTFRDHLPSIPLVGFKSHLGHTLGGAGAVELILSSCALRDQRVPPCANSRREDVEFPDLNLSVERFAAKLENTLNTSLGFGGANTCMILSHPSKRPAAAKLRDIPTHEVAITGIGVLFPNAIGNDAFAQLFKHSSDPSKLIPENIPESIYLHLLSARRVRRMSDYVKLSLAAANLACQNAAVTQDFLQNCSVLLGTTHGSSNFCSQYYSEIVANGISAANPILFAEGVPNAAAAHLSLMLGVQGACQTIIGTRTAGLDALNLAALRIASGQWNSAIVGASEEHSPIVDDAYRHCHLYADSTRAAPFTRESGFVTGPGAVCFVLENAELARQSNRRIHAIIRHSAAAHRSVPHIATAIANTLQQIDFPMPIISSANATWIDRAEQSAIHRLWPDAPMTTIYGHIAESFSVGPLAAIAAVLLGGLTLPGTQFASLCTDYSGSVAATVIERS